MSAAVGYLKSATDALNGIRARDPRFWPVAEALAEADVRRCLESVLRGRGPASVFVPRTEAELEEIFGPPDETPNRVLILHKSKQAPSQGRALLRRMAKGTR